MNPRWLTLMVAAGLVLGGCGDNSPDPTPAQTAAIATLVDTELSAEEQQCMLAGLIDSRVEPETVVDGSLSGDDDAQLLAVALGCVANLTEIPSFVQSFIAGAQAEGTALTDTQARCAIRSLGGGDSTTAIGECLESTADPDGADRSPQVLELLAGLCSGGNNQACDDLHAAAPGGTDSAELGRTCAGQLPDSEGGRCYLDLDA